MRIATYNVEWFNGLFDDDGVLQKDRRWSGRFDVKRIDQLDSLGIVFNALDADAVMVVEAPDEGPKRSTKVALENFARAYGLRANKVLIGFGNTTQQEIALLYDPKTVIAQHDPQGAQTGKDGSGDAPRFDGVFRRPDTIENAPQKVRFSKPPLEVMLTERTSGKHLRLIGVHVKSKAPHGARDEADAMRIAIQNRHKQMAQCIWLRQRVDGHLAAHGSVIVLGDFNDGPGLDTYERLFGRSGIEVVLGEEGKKPLFDPHAAMALSHRMSARPVTSRFWLHHEKRYLQALLDYIMVSPDLRRKNPDWHIWHPFDDPICYDCPELREALLTASDHFPVSLDFSL